MMKRAKFENKHNYDLKNNSKLDDDPSGIRK